MEIPLTHEVFISWDDDSTNIRIIRYIIIKKQGDYLIKVRLETTAHLENGYSQTLHYCFQKYQMQLQFID